MAGESLVLLTNNSPAEAWVIGIHLIRRRAGAILAPPRRSPVTSSQQSHRSPWALAECDRPDLFAAHDDNAQILSLPKKSADRDVDNIFDSSASISIWHA